MTIKHLALPTEIVKAVRDYLGTRPYNEVAGLIAALASAKAVTLEEKSPTQPGQSDEKDKEGKGNAA